MKKPGETSSFRPGGKAAARIRQMMRERGLEKPSSAGAVTKSYRAVLDERKRQLADPAMQTQPSWTPLGPFHIPFGQTFGTGDYSSPSVSARLSSIAVDPSDSAHLLVGSAGGGVWTSRDGGFSWRPASYTDPSTPLAVGAIAFNPKDTRTVYAGTGEGNTCDSVPGRPGYGNNFSAIGAGIIRSQDGGDHWDPVWSDQLIGLGFYRILVDPSNPDHLLAATTGGLFEKLPPIDTWNQRLPMQGQPAIPIWDASMYVNPGGSNVTEVFAASPYGVHQSTDGGATWSGPITLPDAPDPGFTYTRIAVCHAPSEGNVVYVFAAVPDGDPTKPQLAIVWRRDEFGQPFRTIASGIRMNTTQAAYDWFAAVAPNDPGLLYLGAVDLFRVECISGGTTSWENIASRTPGSSIHSDQHAIAFNPRDPATIYIGNDGGIFQSHDAGDTWLSLNTGLSLNEMEYLAPHPETDSWLLAGTQDNGTLLYKGGEVWFQVAVGDGGDCGVDVFSPYTCYHTFYGMGIQKSATGGAAGSWTDVNPTTPPDYRALFYPPLEVFGDLICQGGQNVYFSTDGGATWNYRELADGSGFISSFGMRSMSRVLIGTESGYIYQMDDTGAGWNDPVSRPQPTSGYISSIVADPSDANQIWVTYSSSSQGTIYRSDDSGETWTDVSGILTGVAVNIVVIDAKNPGHVYAATDAGVWRSKTSGGDWQVFGRGLPNVIVADLALQSRSRLLRAGTRSRGVWEIAIDAGNEPETQIYLRHSAVDTGRGYPSLEGVPNPFAPGKLANWWECRDIMIAAAPYALGAPADVDFGRFEANNLGQVYVDTGGGTTRVFVQVHQRGPMPAVNVAVQVFFADASAPVNGAMPAALPPLPDGFWTNFPNNTVQQDSPWQPIGPAQSLSDPLEAGYPAVVAFDWQAPTNTSAPVWLLAVITASNDAIAFTNADLDVPKLVRNSPKCGVARFLVQSW